MPPVAQAPQGAPQGPQGPQEDPRQAQLDQIVQEILGGEIPGTGYLFPKPESDTDPPRRPAPSPDQVRDELLRAILACAKDIQLPFGQEKKSDASKSVLALSQSYLLLDPSLDEEGLPAEGPGSKASAVAAAAAEHPQAPVVAAAGGAKRTVSAPRAQPNAAEEALNGRTQSMQKDLRGARGQTPRPQPRAGG